MDRISIAVDAIKIGHLGSSDSLGVYYQFGSDREELIESLSFSSDPQEDFETYQVLQDDIDVSGQQQVQVVIRARVAGADKALYWDRVRVSAP